MFLLEEQLKVLKKVRECCGSYRSHPSEPTISSLARLGLVRVEGADFVGPLASFRITPFGSEILEDGE